MGLVLQVSADGSDGVMIGDDIKVQVIRANRGNARLRIKAPPGLKIYRQKIYDQIQKERIRR